jgi:FtsH-binding integral membrane protein
MSSADNPYRTWGLVAADAAPTERAQFIRLTYLHLGGAVLVFMALEAVLLSLPGVGEVVAMVLGNRWGWLLVLGTFMGVSYVANTWANSSTSIGMQYMGLGLYVAAEAVIFVPMLYIAQTFGGPDVIPMAGVLTLVVFTGLTAIVFLTGADFSFLRTGLTVLGLAAMGFILCSALFGADLGVSSIAFTAAMIGLASGYILYDTSNVLHHYRIGQHVAASLALFASVALLFWYILRLVMSLTSRD